MARVMSHAGNLFLVATIALGSACGGAQKLTPPPPPLRPEPAATEAKQVTLTDCEPLEAGEQIKAIPFDRRSIPESDKLAEEAKLSLRAADTAEIDRMTREDYITQAVAKLLTALKADPYNVDGTYVLAGAYAKMGRIQCSMNLLTRMLQMRSHASKRADVEAHLDRLLGRKQALDPDFSGMRGDDRFRGLIARMCEGTNDPNCVYGK